MRFCLLFLLNIAALFMALNCNVIFKSRVDFSVNLGQLETHLDPRSRLHCAVKCLQLRWSGHLCFGFQSEEKNEKICAIIGINKIYGEK